MMKIQRVKCTKDYNLIIGSQRRSCFSGATSFWNWSSRMLLNCSLNWSVQIGRNHIMVKIWKLCWSYYGWNMVGCWCFDLLSFHWRLILIITPSSMSAITMFSKLLKKYILPSQVPQPTCFQVRQGPCLILPMHRVYSIHLFISRLKVTISGRDELSGLTGGMFIS